MKNCLTRVDTTLRLLGSEVGSMIDKEKLESTELYSHRFRNFSTLILVPATVLLILVILFSLGARKELVVRTNGELIPTTQYPAIQSTMSGVIDENYFVEGKRVKKGEVLARYHSVEPKSEIMLLTRQIESIQDRLNTLQQLKIGVQTNTDTMKDDSWGYHQSLKDYLAQRKVQESDVGNGGISTKIDSLVATKLQSIDSEKTKWSDDLETLKMRKADLLDQLNQYTIKSSADGVLHITNQANTYRRVSAGTELAQVVPIISNVNNVKIRSFIGSSEITGIRKGMVIRMKIFQNVSKPIILNGKISKIYSSPTPTKQGNVFQVESDVKISHTTASKLRYGLTGTTSIITGEETYWNYMKNEILGLK